MTDDEPTTSESNLDTEHLENPAYGADTIIGVLEEASADGYDVQQTAEDGGLVHCRACDAHLDPADIDVEHLRRLEGASDVDDMMLIAWSHCPNCGEGGVLVLTYGPNAGDADQAVLERLDISHADPSPTD